MTDRELMQQAAEALNRSDYLGWQLNIPIIKALRERLAQPEMQPCAGRNCGSTNPNLHSAECFEDYEKSTGMATQPVAWISHSDSLLSWDKFYDHMEPLYTTPPTVTEPHKRKPLTDEQIDLLLLHHEMMNQWPKQKQIHTFVRAIEAAHGIKEKNT
jgi:hypothetical protein